MAATKALASMSLEKLGRQDLPNRMTAPNGPYSLAEIARRQRPLGSAVPYFRIDAHGEWAAQ